MPALDPAHPLRVKLLLGSPIPVDAPWHLLVDYPQLQGRSLLPALLGREETPPPVLESMVRSELLGRLAEDGCDLEVMRLLLPDERVSETLRSEVLAHYWQSPGDSPHYDYRRREADLQRELTRIVSETTCVRLGVTLEIIRRYQVGASEGLPMGSQRATDLVLDLSPGAREVLWALLEDVRFRTWYIPEDFPDRLAAAARA